MANLDSSLDSMADVETTPFYRVMRWLESVHLDKPPIGRATYPDQEGHQLTFHVSTAFQGNECQALVEYEKGDDDNNNDALAIHRLSVNIMGLLGAQGPLPYFLTERIIRDQLSGSMQPFTDFLDQFHHHLLNIFYKSWAQTQPIVQRSRPDQDRFSAWVSHLAGHTSPQYGEPLALGPSALASKGVEQLRDLVQHYLDLSLEVEEWVGDWYEMPEPDRTSIAHQNAQLSCNAVLGTQVFSRSFRVAFHLREIALDDYLALLPSEPKGRWLAKQIDLAVPATIGWDIVFEIQPDAWLSTSIGSSTSVGLGCLNTHAWLGLARAERVAPVKIGSEDYLIRKGISRKEKGPEPFNSHY